MLDLCTSLALVPYLLAAAYALKLGSHRRGLRGRGSARSSAGTTIIAGVATGLHARSCSSRPGLKFLLLSAVILAPATLLYVKARSEHGRRLFTPSEVGLFAHHPVRRRDHRGRRALDGPHRHLTAAPRHERHRHERHRRRDVRRPLRGRQAAQGAGLRTRPGAQPADPDQLRRPALRRRDVGGERAARPLRLHEQDARTRGRGASSCTTCSPRRWTIPRPRDWLLDRKITPNEVGLGLVDETRAYLESLDRARARAST